MRNLKTCRSASDIAGFKKRYKRRIARQEKSLLLEHSKQSVPVYIFESVEGRNSFEQVIYIPESGRVLILTLSSKAKKEFEKDLETFHQFANSYRRNIEIN